MRPRMIASCCRRCGDNFSTTISGAGRPPVFCSDACRADARQNPNRTMHTRACAICGQTFETTKSSECCSRPRARRGEAREGRFCSRRCRDIAATRRPAQQLDLFAS